MYIPRKILAIVVLIVLILFAFAVSSNTKVVNAQTDNGAAFYELGSAGRSKVTRMIDFGPVGNHICYILSPNSDYKENKDAPDQIVCPPM